MLKTILVASFVGIVILTECILAYLLIPSTANVEAWAKAKESGAAAIATATPAHATPHVGAAATKKDGHGAHGGHDTKTSHGAKSGHGAADAHGAKPAHAAASGHGGHEHEVELGKFNVIIHQPAADVTLRVNFMLFGLVEEKEHHEFTELLAQNQHRLRDLILSEIRNSQTSDLTDPGLALIKRRLLATSNALLGKEILRTIVFSDFSFIEQ